MTDQLDQKVLIQLVKEAGQAIMSIYQRPFDIETKADDSPLTEADLAAHRCLIEGLSRLYPDIPALSEESNDQVKRERLGWQRYWLIDPLDGTKEFIKKNGEFTVNLALIENGQAVFGVVYAPALDTCYWGQIEAGAFKQEGESAPQAIQVANIPDADGTWQVVGSRSHQSEDFQRFMEKLPGAEIVSMGSSLKLCLVAEGKAHLYPRLGPTSEWDTAAAQAVVEAAGGQVLEYPQLTPLRYNTRAETLLNPYFIVCTEPASAWIA